MDPVLMKNDLVTRSFEQCGTVGRAWRGNFSIKNHSMAGDLRSWAWSDITPNWCRFEQGFSDDGGKTCEIDWVNTCARG
jgi:hypothetical protein